MRARVGSKRGLAFEYRQHVFKLSAELSDDLLGLVPVFPRLFTRQFLASAANRKAMLVKQRSDLANQYDVLSLIVSAVTPALQRLEVRELLFPVAKHVRLHPAQLAHFTDGEIPLAGDYR